MGKIGVMVCGHGSRDVEAIAEFQTVAAGIAMRLPQYPIASGFLEFAKPIIRDGLDKLRRHCRVERLHTDLIEHSADFGKTQRLGCGKRGNGPERGVGHRISSSAAD